MKEKLRKQKGKKGNRACTSFNHFFLRTDLRSLGFKAKIYDSSCLSLTPYINKFEILFRADVIVNIIEVRGFHRKF